MLHGSGFTFYNILCYNFIYYICKIKRSGPMKPIPQISDAEYKVMKTVWAHAPISTPQVTKLLAAQNDWSPKTVQTLLSRLVKKRALTYEKRGRAFSIPLW